MENIALPQKIEFLKGEEKNQGKIVIEPCYPGYGTTLGNALRRVMLSSLPGAGVVGVKIEGITHEFMTLPHVKEDILEIILNLKQLRLKVFSDEIVKLNLEVHGEKIVKASDITKDSQVEIANPELMIAHITDMAGKLNIEIYVSQGRGYETIESRNEKKHEIGYIEMDTIFSPIFSVSMNIENVRVGKMTNWDKLVLDVLTDGSITAAEAFYASVNILIDQFNSLLFKDKKAKEDEETEEVKPASEEKNGEVIEIIAEEKESDFKPKKRGRPKKAVN